MPSFAMLNRIFLAVLALLSLAWAADSQQEHDAGIDDHAQASYFVFGSLGYVFALNVVENGDVYFHMNAPSKHAWMGIGFGASMENVRMIVVYIGENGHDLTQSCRISYGHSEPEYDPDCVIEGVGTDHYAPFHNTLSPDGTLIAHSICRGCANWTGGYIDMHSTAQPFIYALGGNYSLRSNDPAAGLRVHETYGIFNLDMTKASNYTGDYGRVPAPQDPALQVGHAFWAFANYFSSTAYGTGSLADWAPAAHAVFMCIAFLLVFPLGAVSLRLVRRATFHAAAQMIGLVFTICGFGLGVYASSLYNKSKHYNSAHQILGLFIFAGLFLQIGLGLTHHLLFMRSGVPTIMGKIHRFFGITIMILAVINGGLGFNFTGRSNVAYGIVVAIMAIIFGILTAVIWFYNRRTIYRPEKEAFIDHQNYGKQPPGEYEMQQPIAGMGHVSTPRTPHYGQARWNDDPENYRDHLIRNNSNVGQESLYTDTPASEQGPFGKTAKWEAIRVD